MENINQDLVLKKLDNFKIFANRIVGFQASLHSYIVSFSWLDIALSRNSKYFILTFMEVDYVKTHIEWKFGGLEVEMLTDDRYRFYDGDYFEVICYKFHISEEVLTDRSNFNSSICLKKSSQRNFH